MKQINSSERSQINGQANNISDQIERMNKLSMALSKAANDILDKAQTDLKTLINDIDLMTSSSNESKQLYNTQRIGIKQAEESQNNVQTSRQNNNQKSSSKQDLCDFDQTDNIEKIQNSRKKLKVGELNKARHQLMQKLKKIDKQLTGLKYQNQISNHSALNSSQSVNSNLQRKSLKTPLKPIKRLEEKQNIVKSQNRTLQILQSFNNQKIKRHQEIITRMKKRQDQEMKKIEQLEQRKIQIQLKKSRFLPTIAQKNKQNFKPNSKPMKKLKSSFKCQ